MRTLEDFIKPTQKELFAILRKIYRGKITSRKGKYILVKGEVPIMLIAHLDTVHKERVKQICTTANGDILMSPQGIGGDDRCGVYGISTVYAKSKKKPWLLFTCDEEIGGVGAEEFCREHELGRLPKELDNLKCLIEIDRKGKDDAVYYDCANDEFEAYITSKGFKTEWGSFSDISVVGPELGVASVNLSSGYYNAHTLHEYISRKQIDATVKRVISIVEEAAGDDFPKYEHVEKNYGYFGRWGRGGWFDDYDYCDALIPSDLPEEYREMYEELADYYDPQLLEDRRQKYGNEYIEYLYYSDFGIDDDAEEKLMELTKGENPRWDLDLDEEDCVPAPSAAVPTSKPE